MNKNQQFHFGRAQHHFQSGNTSHALRHLHLSGTHFGADQPEHSDQEKDAAALYPAIEGECECGCGQKSSCDFVSICREVSNDCGSVLASARERYATAGKQGKSHQDIRQENLDVLGHATAFGRRKHTPGFGVCATCGR